MVNAQSSRQSDINPLHNCHSVRRGEQFSRAIAPGFALEPQRHPITQPAPSPRQTTKLDDIWDNF